MFVLLVCLQKNVDEAVEKLKNKGIQVLRVVCHVSNAQQRKVLIKKTVEVSISSNIFLSYHFLPYDFLLKKENSKFNLKCA